MLTFGILMFVSSLWGKIGDLSCITSYLVLPDFLMDMLLIMQDENENWQEVP